MGQIKLLLADDERIERSILYRKLSRELGEDCEFIQAENGSEAVELFKEHHPQIAVLDIAMPELDGIEAASRIRQMDENCVIIFLTAYSDFQYTRQAIRLRALDYLTKPYDEEELFAVLETAVFQVKKRMEAEKQDAEDRLAGGMSKPCEPGAAVPEKGVVEKESDLMLELDMDDIPEDSGAMSDKTMREIRDFVSQNYMHDISMQDAAKLYAVFRYLFLPSVQAGVWVQLYHLSDPLPDEGGSTPAEKYRAFRERDRSEDWISGF